MAGRFEERLRAAEEVALGPLAVRSDRSRGRLQPEETCSLRSPFQLDRDRILHTKAFRRLMRKTQVFIAPRATTTARGSRTRWRYRDRAHRRARARLNEDLAEAIAPRPRPRAPAVRPHRRGRPRRRAAGPPPQLPPQPAVTAHRRPPGARRPRAQPHRGGAGRHPQPHRTDDPGSRSRAASCASSTGSRTSTTTSTTPCEPGSRPRGSCPRADRSCSATTASSASTRLVHDLIEARRRRRRHHAGPRGRAGDARPALASCSSTCTSTPRTGPTPSASRGVAALFAGTSPTPRSCPAGPTPMTTRRRGSWTMSPA